jgi:hypothetical protein
VPPCFHATARIFTNTTITPLEEEEKDTWDKEAPVIDLHKHHHHPHAITDTAIHIVVICNLTVD